MVTVVPLIEHAPLAVIDGVIGALEVASTVNVDWYVALAGAPVKVTVCGAFAAWVVSETVVAAR
jgi:hypothetical protein